MDRKSFLKKSLGLAGVAVAAPVILRAEQLLNPVEGKNLTSSALDCTVTNSETEGPYPTNSPSTLVRTNIVGDRTGVDFTMNIYIHNVNAACTAYENAIVDVWHCDKDGNYSEYNEYSNDHFLRGRQTTDSNGLVSFTSIFPGWYVSRATHIHVHIYTESGTSLLVTQIAFPEGADSAVYNVNVNGSSYGYTQGMNGYTYNDEDNVFSDGVDTEMATVEGSLAGGYTLEHTIYVNGPEMGVGDVESDGFEIKQNYPNPFREETVLPLTLNETSFVTINLFDASGRQIANIVRRQKLTAGNQEIRINRNQLEAGVYMVNIIVENSQGRFSETKKVMVK